MVPRQTPSQSFIRRICALGRATAARRWLGAARKPERQQLTTRSTSARPRPALHERDDRTQNGVGSIEIPPMDPQLAIGEADDHGAVVGQPQRVVLRETLTDQPASQVIGIAGPRLQLQQKLELIGTEPDQALERSKQRCGPATNVLFSFDQMRVITSIVFGAM